MTGSDLSLTLVIDTLAPGGAEQSTVAILPYLLDRKISPEFIVLRDQAGLEDTVRSFGVPVHHVGPTTGRRQRILAIRSLLAERRPHLVHTCLFESDIAGRLAAASLRLPVVTTLPTELYGEAHVRDPSLRLWKIRASQALDAGTARLATRLHAVSEHVAEVMACRLRYPEHRIDVIPRGRPREMAREASGSGGASLRSSLGLEGRHQVLLVVARHERPKGIDRALEVMPELLARDPDLRLIVAGMEGEHTSELEATVARLGLARSVTFLGHRTDVGDLLRISDVMVLLSRREGLPGALLEAMAAGTPAVVNGLPQVLEVVGQDEAVIVDATSPTSVIAGITNVLSGPAAALKRADRARARFLANFTLDRVADRMREFYETSSL